MEEKFIGLSQESAEKILKASDANYRIVRIDNKHNAVIMNLNRSRINLEIDNDIVTKAYRG